MEHSTVLVIGACGAVGRILVRELLDRGHSVVGVDRRQWPGLVPDGLSLHRIGVDKRPFEDLFRVHKPQQVAHVGLVSSPGISMDKRYEHNVVGMQRVVALCGHYGVRRLVVLSRGTVYGADLRNPVLLNEDAPLRGASHHSGLRDIVEADILAQSLAIREPSLSVAILRPANVVGPRVRNTMVGYLRLPVVPTLLGYDPMLQFIHEEDLVRALRLALASDVPGVFNVPGPGAVPLSAVLRTLAARSLPLLLPFFGPVVETLWRRGLSPAPLPHVDYLRYPCLLDGSRVAEVLTFRPEWSLSATIESIRPRRRPHEELTDMFRTKQEGDPTVVQP